jgi:hypothetical protein
VAVGSTDLLDRSLALLRSNAPNPMSGSFTSRRFSSGVPKPIHQPSLFYQPHLATSSPSGVRNHRGVTRSPHISTAPGTIRCGPHSKRRLSLAQANAALLPSSETVQRRAVPRPPNAASLKRRDNRTAPNAGTSSTVRRVAVGSSDWLDLRIWSIRRSPCSAAAQATRKSSRGTAVLRTRRAGSHAV